MTSGTQLQPGTGPWHEIIAGRPRQGNESLVPSVQEFQIETHLPALLELPVSDRAGLRLEAELTQWDRAIVARRNRHKVERLSEVGRLDNRP